MKNILKKAFITLVIILSATFIISSIAAPIANAKNPDYETPDDSGKSITDDSSGSKESTPTGGDLGSCRDFLGMTSWDCGIVSNPSNQDELASNIVIIASNVFKDITVIAGYLTLAFIIYGGFLYMFSSGDSGKAANSRKVLTRAFIGLAIILLSNVILNSIRFALIQNGSFASIKGQPSPEDIFFNGINWIIGISVVVCLAFVVIGAVGYITSAGDPQKLQKAKNTLMYAFIGLGIVALSAIIKEFVYNLIVNSKDSTGLINETIIAKELHEK